MPNIICDACEEQATELVSCCGLCYICCNCDNDLEDSEDSEFEEGEEIVPNQYGQSFKVSDASHKQLFNCERLAGVEWEFNQVHNNSGINAWKSKWGGQIAHDGSCGQEAVAPPVAGDYLVNCLQDLGKAFKEGEADIDDRCGIHVHVDASDISWIDMFRVLKVYAHVEPILYLLGGQHRINNRYCAPCGESFANALSKPDRKGAVLEAAYTERGGHTGHQYARNRPGKKDNNRYKGLNLCPWLAGRKIRAKDTTVEFRLHRNVPYKDPDRVIKWTMLCVKIVDWAVNATDVDIAKLPKSSLRALCDIIAPECKSWVLERVKNWRLATSFSKGVPRRILLKNGKYTMKLHA